MGVSPVNTGALRRLAGARLRHVRRSVAGAPTMTGSGAAAVTFDDGPHPEVTPQVLDVLAEFGAVATFFLLGREAQRHPDLVARIVAEGHAVGSHTFNHSDLHRVPAKVAMADIKAGREAVEQAVGRATALFRPPHGHLTVNVGARLRRDDWRTWLWSVDSYDWKGDATAAAVHAAASRARAGDVVLFHDTSGVAPHGLRSFLRDARDQGLQFVTLG